MFDTRAKTGSVQAHVDHIPSMINAEHRWTAVLPECEPEQANLPRTDVEPHVWWGLGLILKHVK